jgi:hypothetical protein
LRKEEIKAAFLAILCLNIKIVSLLPAVDEMHDVIRLSKCLEHIDFLQFPLTVPGALVRLS